MATPGKAAYPKERHNLKLGKHTWRAIRQRAGALDIPAGEVIDRALALAYNLEAAGQAWSDVELDHAGLVAEEVAS